MVFSFTREKIDNLIKARADRKLLEYKLWLHEYAEDESSLGSRLTTVRRLFNYLGLCASYESTFVEEKGRSAYFNIASNYRSFDTRILQIKYNIPVMSLTSWKFSRILFFSFRILFVLVVYFIFAVTILYYWSLSRFNLGELWLFEVPTWQFTIFNHGTVWALFSECVLWWVQNIMLFCQAFNDWSYSQFLQFFVLIEGRESWEVFFWGGHDKYIFREAFFNLVGDFYLTNLSLSLFTVCAILLFQIYLLFFIFKFLLMVSDMWNLSVNFSQPVDWDIHFLNVESMNQVMNFDLTQTLLRPGVLDNFLKYYKLGYIDNELTYFNTLENLLFSSRATFFGYRGFLNLFPSKDTVFNFSRVLKKKILPDWWFRVFDFSSTYLRVSPMFSELHRLPLTKNLVENAGWVKRSAETYTIFPLNTFASLKRVNVVSARFSLIVRAVFRVLLGQVDTAARADAERLKELIKPNFKVFWDLKEDDVEDVYSKWHSFEASDNVFDWYSRELEFVTTNSFLRRNFRSVQRKNFRYGLHNLVGNYAFFRKQINYNAVLVHEELDTDNHPFDAEDSIEGVSFPTDNQYVVLPEGEDEVEEPDEEDPQFEEESEDFYKEFLFEDGFLHIDQESVDTLLPEDEVSVDELMSEETLIDTKTIQFPEDEEVYATEEEEWREDVMDIFLTQVGRCPNFWRATSESSYWGKAEVEFGTVRNYRERVFDTIYDDVADFFWLNSDSQNVVSLSSFSRGRIFTDLNVRGWRKVAPLVHLYRKLMGRVTYVRPQINTNFVFLNVPFYAVALFNVFFWLSLFVYLFSILFNVVLLHLLFFDVSLIVLFLLNMLIVWVVLFILSANAFCVSLFRLFLIRIKSIPILLFGCVVSLLMIWTSNGLLVFEASRSDNLRLLTKATRNVSKPVYKHGDLPFNYNSTLEWGFFSRYYVNGQILPSIVFNLDYRSNLDCCKPLARRWSRLPAQGIFSTLLLRDTTFSSVTSFHDLRISQPLTFEFSYLVRRSESPYVLLTSYCNYSSKLFSGASLVLSGEVLEEFLWEKQSRLKFYDDGGWRLTRARDLDRYFTLGLGEGDFSKTVKNVFSRFFFSTHARRMAYLDLVPITDQVRDFVETDSLSQKMSYFSSPSERRRASYLEPRITEYDEGHVSASELGRLFLSRNLLERIYSEQISRKIMANDSEQLFYAQTFGFKVGLGEIKFPRL